MIIHHRSLILKALKNIQCDWRDSKNIPESLKSLKASKIIIYHRSLILKALKNIRLGRVEKHSRRFRKIILNDY